MAVAEEGTEVLKGLSRVFDVSSEMSLYRLSGLGLLPKIVPSGVEPSK